MQKLLKVWNKHGTKFGDKLPNFVKAYKNVKAHHIITNQTKICKGKNYDIFGKHASLHLLSGAFSIVALKRM